MSAIEDLDGVFSIFHDGWMSKLQGDLYNLIIEVECEYLAKRIDASYSRFYLELVGIDKFEFEPWWKEGFLGKKTMSDIHEIAKLELGICSAEIRDDFVIVYCDTYKSDDYTGGNLFLNCHAIKVFDQDKNEVTIDGLTEICSSYWDSFGKKQAYKSAKF